MKALSTIVSIGLAAALALVACSRSPEQTTEPALRTAVPSATLIPTATQLDASPLAPTPSPSPVQPMGAPGTPQSAGEGTDIQWDDREVFRASLVPAQQAVLSGLEGATVYHIDLEILEDITHLRGGQVVRYTNQEAVPLREIYFRLFPNSSGGEATVSRVTVDDRPVDPQAEFVHTALRVPLGEPLASGESVVVELDFTVTVPDELGGTYGVFGYTDSVLALDEVYPLIPVFDDEGWNVELPTGIGDVTYLDASFYVVTVTAPAGLTLVATGSAVDEYRDAEVQVVTFAAGPARDFYLAASDRYEVVRATVGDTTVSSYYFPEHRAHAHLALQAAAAAVTSFSARFGVYPYSELDVLAVPMGGALGIEYPGAVAMGSTLYEADSQVSGAPSSAILEASTAHEVGHQWFYNVVGNDQIDDPWLDEAIVQYLTLLYYIDRYGTAAAQGYRESWVSRWARVQRAEIPIGRPTREYGPLEYGAIVYGRGPLFIEALAKEMGQETFDAFLRDYYQTTAWSIGTPELFQTLAESHCGCDLTPLFEAWVYGD